MIDIRTFEEKLTYKFLWTLLTTTVSFFAIFGLIIFFLTQKYNLPFQDIALFFLMGLIMHLLLSLTVRNVDIIIGNLILSGSISIPIVINGIGKIPLIWPIVLAVNIYIFLNTLYQIILRQKSHKTRGYLFIAMHLVKGLFIWLGYQALSYIISDQPSTINPPLPFIDEFSINFIQTYLIANLLILILNLISSIITLFALNSKLFNIAQNLKKICSWSLDEDILANQVLNGKAELTRQERTILFGDIRGFTKFSNTYTHKIIAFVLQDFYEIVEEVTERYSAYKPEFIADEFLTFFASPDIAVDCALELREKINEQLSPYQLSVGMGIHEGPVLEGIIGGKTSKKYSIIGNAANIASRLQTQAKGNQILCSKRIKNKVENLETGSLMTANLKGIDGKFEIYLIKGTNGNLKKSHESKSRFKPFVFFGKIHKNWKRFLNKYFDF